MSEGFNLLDRLFGPLPRYRMFRECADGYLVGWTTEPIEGHYASMVWRPTGKGSRSGKAERWSMVGEPVIHRTRKAAKARATRLWFQHEQRGKGR